MLSLGVRGIGWLTASGFGSGSGEKRFSMPPGNLAPIPGQAIFTEPDARFGRLDPYAKAGLAAVTFALRDAGLECWTEKRAIGIVATTLYGCLGTDLAYLETLSPAYCAPASPGLFAYTLPGSFLGEAAVRFGLTGPMFMLSATHGVEREALQTACAMVTDGECATVLVGRCDLAPSAVVAGAGPPVKSGALFFVLGAGAVEKERPRYGSLRWGARGQLRFGGREVRSLVSLADACLDRRRAAAEVARRSRTT